ncbi:Uncharacterised protein [Chlamydia trachomatis]|nr:Uncharacterised protein [Chlamydia trachomatis]
MAVTTPTALETAGKRADRASEAYIPLIAMVSKPLFTLPPNAPTLAPMLPKAPSTFLGTKAPNSLALPLKLSKAVKKLFLYPVTASFIFPNDGIDLLDRLEIAVLTSIAPLEIQGKAGAIPNRIGISPAIAPKLFTKASMLAGSNFILLIKSTSPSPLEMMFSKEVINPCPNSV